MSEVNVARRRTIYTSEEYTAPFDVESRPLLVRDSIIFLASGGSETCNMGRSK
jgi:hypothetical protein